MKRKSGDETGEIVEIDGNFKISLPSGASARLRFGRGESEATRIRIGSERNAAGHPH